MTMWESWYEAAGNVIGDYLDTPGSSGELREGAAHDNLRDHVSEGYEMRVSGFSVNGVAGELNVPFRGMLADGTPYEFVMDANGNYTLAINGVADAAYSLDALNVSYVLEGHKEGAESLTDTTDLFLRSADHVIVADAAAPAFGGAEYQEIFGGPDPVDPADDTLVSLAGDEGHDVLFGGAESEEIFGGAGNDAIRGGSGDDTMSGGDGADVFIWQHDDYSEAGHAFTDTFTDFSLGQDKLSFSGIDASDLDGLAGLLAEGIITLASDNEGELTITVNEQATGGGTQVVALHLNDSAMLSDAQFDGLQQNDLAAEAEILQQILLNSGG